jgi:hypothetical protein
VRDSKMRPPAEILLYLIAFVVLVVSIPALWIGQEIEPWLRMLSQLVSTVLVVLFSILLERELVGDRLRTISETRKWLRRCALILLVFLALALGVLGTWLPTRIDAESVVAQASVLLAYGPGGELDWATTFQSRIVEYSPFTDLDGDHVQETLVATEPYDDRGSRLTIVDEHGTDVLTYELRRYGALEVRPEDVDYTLEIPLVYPYSSRSFEVVDLLVQDLDGLTGQEVLVLANDTTQRLAPSLILALKGNGDLAAWYWHLGRLGTARVLHTSGYVRAPVIVILAENPELVDETYTSVVFAFSSSEFFSGAGPVCWNMTSSMSSNYRLDPKQLDEYWADDIGVDLGCPAFEAGALAWYRWIEPDIIVEEIGIGWVDHCDRWLCEERLVVSLALSNGCPLAVNARGQVEFVESIRPCPLVLRPVLHLPWRY